MKHYYQSIQGWTEGITDLYAKMVKRFPSGSRFVEIGTWRGRSAAFMGVEIANSGKEIDFTCIDHWRGTAHDPGMMEIAEKNNLHKEFLANLRRGGIQHLVKWKKASSVWAARDFADRSVDFAFIDAGHDKASVEHDILAWWPKIKDGGVLAGHDYYGMNNPWVAEAVNNLFRPGEFRVDGGRCWVVEKNKSVKAPDPKKVKPRVWVALPNRPGDSISGKTVETLGRTGSRHHVMNMRGRSMSLLNYNFNTLWADAMNRRGEFEYFVMIHADVSAELGWLDKLIDEYNRLGADVLSCVIAIKDTRGISSTGLMNWSDRIMRKLSIRQCLKLGRSFSARDIGADVLLMNTGLWIARLDRPWAEKFDGFRSHDRVFLDKDGEWKAQAIGEDYLWSVDLARMGVKTYATNCVKTLHTGTWDYPNFTEWGQPETEEVGFAWKLDRGERREQSKAAQAGTPAAAGSRSHRNGRNGTPRRSGRKPALAAR